MATQKGRAHGGLGPPRPGGTVDPDHGSGPWVANRAARGGLAGQPDKAAAHARTAAGDGSTTRRRTREAEGKREEGGLTVRRAARGDERGGELLRTTAGWCSRGGSTGWKRRTEAGMTWEGDGMIRGKGGGARRWKKSGQRPATWEVAHLDGKERTPAVNGEGEGAAPDGEADGGDGAY
uniref:Uncharacterized protein n=1 Tax=Oryza sativa subsp. japonica TaxID=39947 RepID=Q6Z643_ORYSJ|nr:hypothetical protein [Oryza sativa Japonica Group]